MPRYCAYLIPDNNSQKYLFSHTFRRPFSHTIPPKEAMPSLGFYLTVILEVFSQRIRMSKDYHVYIFKDSDCTCCLFRITTSIEIWNSGSCNRITNWWSSTFGNIFNRFLMPIFWPVYNVWIWAMNFLSFITLLARLNFLNLFLF